MTTPLAHNEPAFNVLKYLVECTLATVEVAACTGKRTAKAYARQVGMGQVGVDWLVELGLLESTERAFDVHEKRITVGRWAANMDPARTLPAIVDMTPDRRPANVRERILHLLECTLGTIEQMAARKSRDKHEHARQIAIAQQVITWVRARSIDVPAPGVRALHIVKGSLTVAEWVGGLATSQATAPERASAIASRRVRNRNGGK